MTNREILVLVVDDHEEDFILVKRMLSSIEHLSFKADWAPDREKGIKQIRKNIHDVCLLDHHLGMGTGLEFLKEAVQSGYSAPIILLTGQGDTAIDLEAIRLGAADFLNKNMLTPYLLERSIRYALERQKTEKVRSRLASVVEGSTDAICVSTLEGVILNWNPGAGKVYGYDSDEMIGRNISRVLPPKRQEEFSGIFEVVQKGKPVSGIETIHQRKDGKLIMVSLTVSPLKEAGGRVNQASIIARDMTESERAKVVKEKLLLERDALWEQHQLQMVRMPIACILMDENFKFTFWNPAAEEMFGYPFREVEGRHPKGTIVSDARWPFEEPVLASLALGRTEFMEVVAENIRKDGSTIICEWHNTALYDSEKKFHGLMSMALDITDRQRNADSLAQLAAVVESSRDAIFGTDLDFRINVWNPAAQQLYGHKTSEIIGQYATVIAPPGSSSILEEMLRMCKMGRSVSNFETQHIDNDLRVVDVSLTLSPLRGKDGRVTGISIISRDITEMKKAEVVLRKQEERIRQGQKMEAIGQLAAGVAHDFNNLLSVVSGNSEFLLSELPADDPRREEVEEIKKAVQRGSELTRQLLMFGHKDISKPTLLDLNQVIAETGKMLSRMIGENIEFIVKGGKELRHIKADSIQIQQVLMNLAVNARDAMPQGGRFLIETRNMVLEETYEQKRIEVPAGSYVMLTVSDTGTGMDLATQEHIFEPFFTTKEAGKGTGLGLATVYGIVKKCGGYIWAYSGQGEGATFNICFPSVEPPESPAVEKARAVSVQGTETVLVAEDEEAVRKIVTRTLQRQGYRVLQAVDGEDGIEKAGLYPERIHLLLTDTVMPRKSGKELADRLQKDRPGIKVLFMSGYPREVLSKQGVLDPSIQMVQKPFSAESLLAKIREVLNRDPAVI